MKKPAWSSTPVLDVRALTDAQLTAIAKGFDETADLGLLPLAQLDRDPNRNKIDAVFCKALGLPDISFVRELLAREPGLSAHDIGTEPAEEESDAAE